MSPILIQLCLFAYKLFNRNKPGFCHLSFIYLIVNSNVNHELYSQCNVLFLGSVLSFPGCTERSLPLPGHQQRPEVTWLSDSGNCGAPFLDVGLNVTTILIH